MKLRATLLALALAATVPAAAHAQFLGQAEANQLRADSPVLKPPPGAKVAIVVFEDLRCPACAYAHPFELPAAEENHVPLVRYDFPIASHVWTFEGAVCARYLEDRLKNPRLAAEYRDAVFKAQRMIGSKDDLQAFNAHWFPQHGQVVPFVMDPDGALARRVQADYDAGIRLNVQYTPTIVVVTRDKYQVVCGTASGQVTDVQRLAGVVAAAVAETKAAPAATPTRKRPTSR